MELCKNKDKLKKERANSRELRGKIVGEGNTMDSFGDKFQSNKNKKKKNKSAQPNPFKPQPQYDPYSKKKSLSEKIGVILGDVDKVKSKEGEGKQFPKAPKKKEELPDDDLIGLGMDKPQPPSKRTQNEDVDFL